jgi:hypothetical protein
MGEGRRKKEEGRRKKEEGRRKKEEGRRKKALRHFDGVYPERSRRTQCAVASPRNGNILTVLVMAMKIHLWVDTTHSFYL